MIIYTWGQNGIDLGTVAVLDCPQCGRVRPFNAFVEYTYRGSWVFLGITAQEHFVRCRSCEGGWRVETHEVGTLGWDVPAPFWHKHGWKVGLLLFLILFAAVALVPWFTSALFPPASYYPLEEGQHGTYQLGNGRELTREVEKIESIEGGRRALIVVRIKGDDQRFTETIEERADGVYLVEVQGNALTEAVCLLRYPIQRGATWQVPASPEHGRPEAGSARVVALDAPVDVPYGDMKAVQIETIQGDWQDTTYYVRGLGVVRALSWNRSTKRGFSYALSALERSGPTASR